MIISFLFQVFRAFVDALLAPIFFVGLGLITDRLLHFELRTLSRLCLYILSPALLFSSLMKVEITLEQTTQVILFVFLVMGGMGLLSYIYARICRMDRPTTAATIMAATFFNAVTLGFPFVLFAFGEKGLSLAAILVATNSLPHNVCGLLLAVRGVQSTGQSLRRLLKMPIPYAILAALLFRIFNFSLPSSVFDPIDILGKAGIPVVLITIGMELGRIPIRMNHSDVVGVVILRLIVGPLWAWTVASIVGLTGLLGQVVLLQASMPTAIMPIVFAREFGGNIGFISRAVLFSTLASILTLSVILVLIRST